MLQPVILAQDLRRNWLKLLRICVTKPWLIRAFSRDGDAEVSGEHVSRLPKQQLLQCVVLASGAQARASQGPRQGGKDATAGGCAGGSTKLEMGAGGEIRGEAQ